jgi:anti-sigma B factor antagonist
MELLQANVVDCLHYRILVLHGEIDASVKDQLQDRVLGLLNGSGMPLLIDMTGVKFCDSTGLAVALAANRQATETGCKLAFCGLSERVGKVFQVTGMDRLVAVYPTLTEASQALTSSPKKR